MTDQVERAYADFMFVWDKREKSRAFLPFLEQAGPARDWLLAKIEQRPFILLDFDFSLQEWSLLELENYDELFEQAVKKNKLELAYVVGKATNKYNICCFLEDTPLKILKILQDHLPGHELATAYLPYADLQDMLYYGLIPCPYITELREDYLQVLELKQAGFSSQEIKHWLDVEDSDDYLNRVGFWSLITKDYAQNAAKMGNSYPCLFSFPDLLYQSMRPKTNMQIFQTPVSNTYSLLEEIPRKKMAVTRYAAGMSQGLYYGEREKDICGYFYYAEPESTTYLVYRRSLTAFNKTSAARKLLKKKDSVELQSTLRELSLGRYTEKKSLLTRHQKGELPADLRFTVQEAHQLIYPRSEISPDLLKIDRKVYLGKYLELYAYEDKLDQPLCKLAQELGYDLLILTHMVGSHQIVTEVLDTRENSFKHLWFLR